MDNLGKGEELTDIFQHMICAQLLLFKYQLYIIYCLYSIVTICIRKLLSLVFFFPFFKSNNNICELFSKIYILNGLRAPDRVKKSKYQETDSHMVSSGPFVDLLIIRKIQNITTLTLSVSYNIKCIPHIQEGLSPISISQWSPFQPAIQVHFPEPSMPSSHHPCCPQLQAEKEK